MIFKEMEYDLQKNMETRILQNFTSKDNFNLMKKFLWLLAFIQNVIVIMFYRREDDAAGMSPTGGFFLTSIAVTQVVVSIILIFIWFLVRYPHFRSLAKTKLDKEQ